MKILFICTHNRCRSILCEAITNHLAKGRIIAYSAGSQPAERVHPLSIQYLQERNISTKGLKSQSWDDFEASPPDVVITVCDNAANEPCPAWFGNCAVRVHWGLPDPSRLQGPEESIKNAFMSVMDTIEARINKLISITDLRLDETQLTEALIAIGKEVE